MGNALLPHLDPLWDLRRVWLYLGVVDTLFALFMIWQYPEILVAENKWEVKGGGMQATLM